MTGIYKIDDSDNQPGHWFYLDITKPEMDNIRTWLKQNLGRSTRMTGSVSTGWVPLHADRQWTIMSDAQSYKKPRESYLVIWQKTSAALFMTFFPPTQSGYPDSYFLSW